MEDVSAEIEQAAALSSASNVAAGADKEKVFDVKHPTEDVEMTDKTDEEDPAATNATTPDDDASSSTSTDLDLPDLDDDEDKAVSPEEAERLLLVVMELKEKGNAHFTKQQRDDATRCYRRALHRLKKLKKGPADSLDPQVASLYTTLATNLATVLFQQQKYQPSVAAATQALEVTPMHVKALYRRAVAHRRVGNAEQALRDLQTALTVEPTHAACRKERQSLQQAIKQAAQQQKQSLRKAFAGGVSLYDDKAAPKTAAELEAEAKQQWEDECVRRMAKGEPAVSFDEWVAEKKEAEEKAKEAARKAEEQRKKKEKAERKKRLAAQKAQKKEKDDSSSDEELTEAEWQALRGYKKTKDGRVTSYFTREVDDHAPIQGPQKLEAALVAAPPVKKGPSAWNRAGTWEEKDCTTWCHERLRARLAAVQTDTCRVCAVDSLTGEASVVWTTGKQRYVYDFHATLHYTWNGDSKDDEKKKLPKGIVKLPDISSTSTHEGAVDVLFEGWKRAPSDPSQAVSDWPALETALQGAVNAWLDEFHAQYKAH